MPPLPPDDTTQRYMDLVGTVLGRWPASYWTDDATGDPVVDFDPPLTTAERTTAARLLRLARSRVTGISPTEWAALEPRIDEIRTFRTRTAQEWSAMTAAQRDNALIQWCQDITDVLRAMLRS